MYAFRFNFSFCVNNGLEKKGLHPLVWDEIEILILNALVDVFIDEAWKEIGVLLWQFCCDIVSLYFLLLPKLSFLSRLLSTLF